MIKKIYKSELRQLVKEMLSNTKRSNTRLKREAKTLELYTYDELSKEAKKRAADELETEIIDYYADDHSLSTNYKQALAIYKNIANNAVDKDDNALSGKKLANWIKKDNQYLQEDEYLPNFLQGLVDFVKNPNENIDAEDLLKIFERNVEKIWNDINYENYKYATSDEGINNFFDSFGEDYHFTVNGKYIKE